MKSRDYIVLTWDLISPKTLLKFQFSLPKIFSRNGRLRLKSPLHL